MGVDVDRLVDLPFVLDGDIGVGRLGDLQFTGVEVADQEVFDHRRLGVRLAGLGHEAGEARHTVGEDGVQVECALEERGGGEDLRRAGPARGLVDVRPRRIDVGGVGHAAEEAVVERDQAIGIGCGDLLQVRRRRRPFSRRPGVDGDAGDLATGAEVGLHQHVTRNVQAVEAAAGLRRNRVLGQPEAGGSVPVVGEAVQTEGEPFVAVDGVLGGEGVPDVVLVCGRAVLPPPVVEVLTVLCLASVGDVVGPDLVEVANGIREKAKGLRRSPTAVERVPVVAGLGRRVGSVAIQLENIPEVAKVSGRRGRDRCHDQHCCKGHANHRRSELQRELPSLLHNMPFHLRDFRVKCGR